MIQDIGAHRFSNAYQPIAPDKKSYALYYNGKEVMLGRNEKNEIVFPTFEELEKYNEHLYEDYTFLFTIDEDRFYLLRTIDYGMNFHYHMENTEVFRSAAPLELAFAGITGAQLYRWYNTHRFCGRCGKSMMQDKKERMLYCKSCNNQEYPKIMPAVIVGVTHGNRLLLSKYANRDYTNYALLAGFAEIGESIEETVTREVMEEVGLRVKNLRYYKSQPWAFSDTLLLGFYAELDGDEAIILDEEELSVAEWFERDEIPVKENHVSLTNDMIMRFKRGEVGAYHEVF